MTGRLARTAGFVVALACAACGENRTAPALPDSLRVKQISVSPGTIALTEGEEQKFTARVTDISGMVLDVNVRWESTNPLLTIDSAGLATLTGNPPQDDSASVIARVANVAGDAEVQLLWQVPLTVWPDTNVLFTGMNRTLVARLDSGSHGFPGSFPGPHVDIVPAQ